MKNLIVCFILILFITSCEKAKPVPDEFDFIIGKWKAYEYTECYNVGTPQDYCIDYPVDSLNIEYSLSVNRDKIEIYNAHTLSSQFDIKEINLIIPDSVYINFMFTGKRIPSFEKQHFLIVFNKNEDEITVQSGYSENNTPANLYLTSYKMIREN